MAGIKRPADSKSKAGYEAKKRKTVSAASDSEEAVRKSKDRYPPSVGEGNDSNAGSKRSRPSVNNSSKSAQGKQFVDKNFKVAASSAEAHATQRALAKERKAAKPNADLIARAKQLWGKLRRKSHVPLEERKELVAELYTIINGRVHDFVFKHDVVRVVQCAIKYANKEQRLNITKELQADIRPLVESKYGKFMVAKIVVEGDQEIRNLVIPEFYGHVKRLINHPEAAWIVDDIYRQVANVEQKARMLREWYGQEFALDNRIKEQALKQESSPVAELSKVLAATPEKRAPIMKHLHQLINSLVQKKMTGFTMLHDAMYQYFTNLPAGSEERNDFLENLKSDLDDPSGGGDLLKNLAFTKSGSKVVCLALAHGSAKDRKTMIRVYKDVIETMAFDAHAYKVLLVALEVTDDTKMSAKSILSELLFESISDEAERTQRLLAIAASGTARVPLLFYLTTDTRWLLPAGLPEVLQDIYQVRESTSKKAPETRRSELASSVATQLLSLVSSSAQELVKVPGGCQVISEVLLGAAQYVEDSALKTVVTAVASLAAGNPSEEGHLANNAAVGKMLRTLCREGRYDKSSKSVIKVEKALGVANELSMVIEPHCLDWATGPSSFVIVAMLESESMDKKRRDGLVKLLKKGKATLQSTEDNPGTRLVLEKL